MPGELQPTPRTYDHHLADLRAALVVSALSVAWTMISSAGAVTIGLRSGTLVLVAFGAIGVVDAMGSIALVYHFRRALRHARISERTEAVAHYVVLCGLFVVGAASAVAGVLHATVLRSAPEGSGAAITLVAMSLVALSALSVGKQRIARRVPSHALLSDGHLSGIGAMQAGVTLAGTAIAASVGLKWVDGAATAVIGAVAMGVAVATWREKLVDYQRDR